jgi:hypothetical protein
MDGRLEGRKEGRKEGRNVLPDVVYVIERHVTADSN